MASMFTPITASRVPRWSLILFVALTSITCYGQDDEDVWHYDIAASLWTGNTGVEVLPAGVSDPIKIELPDFLNNFQLGLILHGEARKRKLGMLLDVGYIQLTASDEPEVSTVDKVSVDVNSTLATLSGIFRAHQGKFVSLDIMPGLQYYNGESDIAVSGDVSGLTSGNQSFWDPILGVRIQGHFLKKVQASVYGNVGGFGASSQSTSQVAASLGYSLLDVLAVQVGYRLVDWEFDEGAEEVLLAQRISGLTVGFKLSLRSI